MIQIEKLTYHYHDGTHALHDVSLSIKDGEKICLAGPNGAGKTTLLHCMAGLLKTKQTILNPASFGLVFQNPDDQLFCPSLAEDVGFGPRNQKKPRSEVETLITDSLSAVGLDGFENRHAHHLSGGEKKELPLPLCSPVNLISLPLMSLGRMDARAARAVTKIMREFKGTIIVSTHDLRHADKICDRIIIIDHGKLVADMPMQNAMNDEVLLEKHGLEI